MRTCFKSPCPTHTSLGSPLNLCPTTHVHTHMHAHSGTLREAGQFMEQHVRQLIYLIALLVTYLFMERWKMNQCGWIEIKYFCLLKICPFLKLSSILCEDSCLLSFIQVHCMSFTYFPEILSSLVEPGFTRYWGRRE